MYPHRPILCLLLLSSISLLGFRCGPLVQDCLESSECSAGALCVSYRCVVPPLPKCGTDQDCSAQTRCLDGRCRPRPACTEDTDCKRAERCEQGACVICSTDAQESCNNKDDDCDGKIDEDLTRSCYDGPQNTENKGLCRSGTQRCSAGQWGSCEGQRLPAKEACNWIDDNCDGKVDEGCRSGSRQLYEWCSAKTNAPTNERCDPKWSCHAGMCQPKCDLSKGREKNSDCPNPTDFCEPGSEPGVSVCKLNCDEQLPGCPVGMYCEQTKTKICIPNKPPRYGLKELDQSCVSEGPSSDQCNASKGLACFSGQCKLVCQPVSQGVTTCPTGQRCVASLSSFLGGFCAN